MWDNLAATTKKGLLHTIYYCPNTALTMFEYQPWATRWLFSKRYVFKNFKKQRVVHFVCHDGTEDLFLYVSG